MDKSQIRIWATLVMLISLNTSVNAAIISIDTVDTEYSTGRFANLQGLEWLSLDVTRFESRTAIERDALGLSSSGWRYASRSEAESLLTSLWGGTYSGWSADNSAGASWFINTLGATHPPDDFASYTNYMSSHLIFGNPLECSRDSNYSCNGTVGWAESAATDFSAVNAITDHVETSYFAGIDTTLGYFSESFGTDMGFDDYNGTFKNSRSHVHFSSLIVREVLEPSILALLVTGLGGLGIARRRKQ